MAWTVISAFVLDQLFGYQTANFIRGNLICLASRRSGRFLGGSRSTPNFPSVNPDDGTVSSYHPSLGPHDAFDYVDVEIDGTNATGLTYQARVEVRVGRTGQSITPKIRNITDSTDAGTGAACSAANGDYAGTNQRQTIALTIPTGVKKYRLQYNVGSVSGDTFCTGEIEAFATA